VAEEKAEGGLVFHPLDQFIVKPLFGDGAVGMFTITNATLWMAISVLAIAALFVFGTKARDIVPGRVQSIAELIYSFIYKMVEDVCGKDGAKYFPYIMTLFVFILFANYLALLPMSFSPTSHIVSYFVRPVSHSIRLAGNIMAGHAVIKVFAGFAAIAAISPVSIAAITAIYGLEVLVAGIQAYVFTILTCVYLKDALHPHH